MNTHVSVSNIRADVSKMREEVRGQVRSVRPNLIHPVESSRRLTVC